MTAPGVRYCTHCGAATAVAVPAGDNRPRQVCGACATVHYENPKVVVGCVPEWEGRVLLCRRAIEPRVGYWTLPAGYLENGESTEAGALREALEEAGVDLDLGPLYALFSVPHINQVHLLYRAYMRDGSFSCGVESLEVRLFDEADIPWDQLAFRTVRETLRRYFADRRAGSFAMHSLSLGPP